jgi:tetratricopeptide (TPR) repeat protein
MKKIILVSFLIFKIAVLSAQDKIQIKLTSTSPSASLQQELGSATIKIAYSRPLVRDRKIFGELVPFDKLWRTGASDCTTFTTDEDIIFGDTTLKTGSYSLFTIPSKKEWTVIVNTDTTLHGESGYDEKKDVFRFKVPVEQIQNFYETFTIEINDINSKGEGFLKILWENTLIKIPLKSTADADTMALIEANLVKKTSQDPKLLFQAANYYSITNRDTRQAISWLLEAEKLDTENFYYPNLRQKLAADLKEYAMAIEASKKAIAIAERTKMKGGEKLKIKIKEWELLVKETK